MRYGGALAWLLKARRAIQQCRTEFGRRAELGRNRQGIVLSEILHREIAGMLDIAYGTARTHLYNAIHKLGITKKSELLFLLGNWDFSNFDREW